MKETTTCWIVCEIIIFHSGDKWLALWEVGKVFGIGRVAEVDTVVFELLGSDGAATARSRRVRRR